MSAAKAKTMPRKSFAPPIEAGKQDLIALSQRISPPVFAALRRYKKDMGLASEQDVIRILCAQGLIREGYLERSND